MRIKFLKFITEQLLNILALKMILFCSLYCINGLLIYSNTIIPAIVVCDQGGSELRTNASE